MKFLLDVCASSRALRTLLTELGHDVFQEVREGHSFNPNEFTIALEQVFFVGLVL
jgi:hypothetical protein